MSAVIVMLFATFMFSLLAYLVKLKLQFLPVL